MKNKHNKLVIMLLLALLQTSSLLAQHTITFRYEANFKHIPVQIECEYNFDPLK